MIERNHLHIGCDPEFFFKKKSIIPSLRVIVESSKVIKGDPVDTGRGLIIRDGFQGELNPLPDTCRQRLAGSIGAAVRAIDAMGYRMTLGAGYWVPETEFATLSSDSKRFGCNGSENIYGEQGAIVDAKKYMFRPAGGHMHLSLSDHAKRKIPSVVRLLDIFVGNTAVAFDQDPLQVERRRNYGRAGEYRVKSYGVEYRTPSNFWLGHYRLMGLVFGLARMPLSILADDYSEGTDHAQQILDTFRGPEIAEAINTNNKELAIENFLKLRPFIDTLFEANFKSELERFPVFDASFDKFVELMRKGVMFDTYGHDHWLDLDNQINTGWERFILEGLDLSHINDDYNW